MKYHWVLILALAMFLGASYYMGYTPVALSVVFLLSSVVSYFLYAKDKAAARTGSWRVSENTLHLWAMLFGWPGSLIAQQRLRHKTKKQSFRVFFWISVLINLGFVGWIHGPQGNGIIRYGAHELENITLANVPYVAPVSVVLFLTKFREKEIDWFR
jgi:uncharacterized membrane protein YsdA (DUF1294 family)